MLGGASRGGPILEVVCDGGEGLSRGGDVPVVGHPEIEPSDGQPLAVQAVPLRAVQRRYCPEGYLSRNDLSRGGAVQRRARPAAGPSRGWALQKLGSPEAGLSRGGSTHRWGYSEVGLTSGEAASGAGCPEAGTS